MAAKLATVLKEENGFNLFSDEEEKELIPSIFESETIKENVSEIKTDPLALSEEHFKKLLDISAYVYKEKEKSYIDKFNNSSTTYKEIYSFLNKKAGAFKKEITDEITKDFIQYLDDKHAIFWNGMKLPRSIAIAIQSSFKIVSGHSFTSFLNVMKSKAYDGFGRETLKALNYLKISNTRINEKVSYYKALEDVELVNKVMEENPALFYPSLAYIGFKGLNQYQEMKITLNKLGLSKKGWKFMCLQTKNYNLRSIRKIHVGIFCMNNHLKDAWLRNDFLAAWMRHEKLRNKSDILLKEIENYNGAIKDFSPFQIRKRKESLAYTYECPELDQLNDYINHNKTAFLRDPRNAGKDYKEDSKTLFQLLRRSERWHEEVLKKERGDLKKFINHNVKEKEFDGFNFEQITDSWELKKEGDKMHHCVFSYTDRCHKNKYAVYKVDEINIKKGSKTLERATLGLTVNEKVVLHKDESTGLEKEILVTTITFSQMYGYCNSSVSNEMRAAAQKLIKEINKKINNG